MFGYYQHTYLYILKTKAFWQQKQGAKVTVHVKLLEKGKHAMAQQRKKI